MKQEIVLVGLNHCTAPVAIRELITFPGNEDGATTRKFLAIRGVSEAVVISTCNRSEALLVAEAAPHIAEDVIQLISDIHRVPAESFSKFLYLKRGRDAVHHVFRVASSLDSMVLGEPQILGQVKEGYRRASYANATGPILNRLMHKAFFTAKRVRNETGVALAAVSVAYVAVELAKKILGDLKSACVLLIGAGEMAELAARHLVGHVANPPIVLNRTLENACVLADRLNGRADTLDALKHYLLEADVVITSTGSCESLIRKDHVEKIMKKRRYRPLFIIDIALPRDVEPSVNELDGVYLYNIDDLQTIAAENLTERRQEAMRAEKIVDEETAKFMEWTASLSCTPTLVAIRNKLEEIRLSELARSNGKLAGLTPEQREAVEIITRSIVNKIAHYPISCLKRTKSKTKQSLYLDVAQELFALSGETDTSSQEDDQQEKKRQDET
ncbi:MAG: glutamyl-tRNA reductase [Desulfomonilaceae bacterium]